MLKGSYAPPPSIWNSPTVLGTSEIDIQAVPKDCMENLCYHLGSEYLYTSGAGKLGYASPFLT